MNSHGQFSLDLLLAVVAVFTFLIVLQGILAGVSSDTLRQSVTFQEKSIALSVANVLMESTNLLDGSAQIDFTIPNLRAPSSRVTQCQVVITHDQVTVSAQLDGLQLVQSQSVVLPLSEFAFPTQPIACGSQMSMYTEGNI